MKQKIAMIIMLLGLTGCASHMGPQEERWTSAGAISGGVVGAFFGSGAGHLLGAAVGAGMGGTAGNYVGRQWDMELNQQQGRY